SFLASFFYGLYGLQYPRPLERLIVLGFECQIWGLISTTVHFTVRFGGSDVNFQAMHERAAGCSPLGHTVDQTREFSFRRDQVSSVKFRPLAEGVGFEPTIRFPVYTLSKRAP